MRLLGVALLAMTLVGMGAPEEPRWTGVISAKGHEPFVFLALIDEQGHQWRLEGDVVNDLWDRAQGRRVVLTGQHSGKDVILVRSWAWADDEE